MNLLTKWTITGFLMASGCALAGPVLLIYPNNNLFPPNPPVLQGNGQVVGVGFNLTNDNQGYLVVTGVDLSANPSPVGLKSNWVDLLSPTISSALAPSAALSANWVSGTSGLGEFFFASSPNAFAGPTVSVVLSYDLYTADPFTSGSANLITSGLSVSAPLHFNESGPASSPTPEPSSVVLLLTGGAGLVVWKRRRQGIAPLSRRP